MCTGDSITNLMVKDDDIASESSQFIESELESIRNKLDSLDLSTYLYVKPLSYQIY